MLSDLLVSALRDPRATEVRRRLFRQLVSSLLYEGAVDRPDAGGRRQVIVGRDEHEAPVRYLVETRRAAGFDRVRVGPGPVLRVADDGGTAEADSVARFLAEVACSVLDGAHPDELVRFTRELEETRVKDALAQHVRARRGDVLDGADHDTLEGTVTDGHRYHPTYKSRIGFDLADDVAYGPEFLPELHPGWLAAHALRHRDQRRRGPSPGPRPATSWRGHRRGLRRRDPGGGRRPRRVLLGPGPPLAVPRGRRACVRRRARRPPADRPGPGSRGLRRPAVDPHPVLPRRTAAPPAQARPVDHQHLDGARARPAHGAQRRPDLRLAPGPGRRRTPCSRPPA